ncbi:MAG: methionine adenosyltransferase [Candidatus Eisenbacteria bacterium]|uniref:S-adenosylmethionine synthase n=1 Tax=Eiseniibacteriota bacterium TaxID=2212470 RepID=A0A538TUE4_UNCEI|nr:MAG: methionine adenosyltransferase [Candidatus Eisenbacteria bacterium]
MTLEATQTKPEAKRAPGTRHALPFTSESVTEGHPDKVADQISDAILDAILKEDPLGRVACETLVTTGLALVSGEVTTKTYVDIPKVVRETIRSIGYDNPVYGFDYETCAVLTCIDEQSKDIAMGVDRKGAGDQGLMFGYAVRETPELMPLPIQLAHKLTRALADARRSGKFPELRPDGKSQVTVDYEGGVPKRINTVVVSTQHVEMTDAEIDRFRERIIREIIKPVLPRELVDGEPIFHINPTGRFVLGGPRADTGVTGRKIIVDTYGGSACHGGGAFSGKDPSKVDRSASYAARHVAKNLVGAGLADRCTVQVAYAIGVEQPVSVMVDSHGTGKVPDTRLSELVRKHFDLSPAGIIQSLDLRKPIYRKTAAYGHFGRENEGFRWELLDRVEDLKRDA